MSFIRQRRHDKWKTTYPHPPFPTLPAYRHRWSGFHRTKTYFTAIPKVSRVSKHNTAVTRVFFFSLKIKNWTRVKHPAFIQETGEKGKKETEPHLMLPTSFPTLFAYAPWSLDSFVLRLILKNTSSPAAETTWDRRFPAFRATTLISTQTGKL